jgi:phenylalanyl-tRNA synthetase beta chain
MPTISIRRDDLERLIGHHATDKELDIWLPLVKGEVKDVDTATGELRIELQDSNRPDLWCVEGIARQIRCKLQRRPPAYPYLKSRRARPDRLLVDKGLDRVRPFIAACKARGYAVSSEALTQLIQTQEKLAEIFGRKRRTVSIGLYRLSPITFPVSYLLMDPDAASFRPLGYDEPMTLREILEIHPKGLEYAGILEGQERYPLLRDAQGVVLSLPPIINSREIGEVQAGESELFVEVTGTELRMVMLALNIFAANLHDRGATIEPMEIVYPYKTEFGRTIRMPQVFTRPRKIARTQIVNALGTELTMKEVRSSLTSYGYAISGAGERLDVQLPAYRDDVMHSVDVVEDVAVSRGYGSFSPIMPSAFTVGGLARLEQLSDKVRELMVGFGFQEIVSNILSSREELLAKMRLDEDHPGGRLVMIDNVMSQSGECLRQWLLPSLLRVEAASSRSFYPHLLFEVGETAIPDPQAETGSRTELRLCGLLAHSNANFSEAHSVLALLGFYLNTPDAYQPIEHPSFIQGRVAEVHLRKEPAGLIGELHPEVLTRWQIGMPCSMFELALEPFLK